jgi:hypothetical protein
MKIELEEIVEISPKILLCNKLPKCINEEDIINFLKNDVLFMEYKNIQNALKIDAYVIGLLLNIDEIATGKTEDKELLVQSRKLISEISELGSFKKFVITANPLPNIKKLFRSAKFEYFEYDKSNKHELLYLLKGLVCPNEKNVICRTNLRLHFRPEYYNVLIKLHDYEFNGFINDLSFSGMGIILDKYEDFKKCKIGSFLTIRIDFKVSFLQITKGMIVRKDKSKNLIGIQIDIQDKFMIDDSNASMLESIINTWITKIIQSKSVYKFNENTLKKT